MQKTNATPMSKAARILAAAAIAAGTVTAGTAQAGSLYEERIYDDSFGNLVIHNPSGYKRIIVGKGYIAAELERQDVPEIVYFDESRHNLHVKRCYTPPYRWHGRGRMYGLDENVVPTPPRICE